MDGFMVTTMDRAAALGDLFVTATGNIHVIDRKHFDQMKDGAILANSGHFNSEVNIGALEEMAGEGRRTLRPFVEEFVGRAAQVGLDGNLWVTRVGAFGAKTSVVDVFDASGKLVRRVMFPATHRLAGFGKGTVYLVRTDNDGLQWVERYAIGS